MTDEVSSDGHLLDYVYVLVRWRRLIVVGTLLAAVGGAVISVLLPERWTSTTTLLPPEEEPTGLGLSLLAGAGGGFAAQNADELTQRIQQVLQSVGVPQAELEQLLPDGPVGPKAPAWGPYGPPSSY